MKLLTAMLLELTVKTELEYRLGDNKSFATHWKQMISQKYKH
jgi:hypothetical protein